MGGLSILFGGVGVKDADFDLRFGEGALNRAVVASGTLDDGDQVFDAMPGHGIADSLQGCLEASLVVLDGGRFHKDPTIEVSEHHLGAGLGAIHTEKGEMVRTGRLDAWMNHATRFVDGV